jgi:hypothetical protein
MKRKILSLLLIGFGLFLNVACQGPDGKLEWPDDSETKWLSYQETQCANPWGYGNSNQDKVQYIKDYLEKQGVKVKSITLTKENDGAMCMACTCASGRVLKVQVRLEDEAKLIPLGFKPI